MSQKSSLLQPAESVSRVLTADSLDKHCAEALAAEIKDANSEMVKFGGLQP